MQKIEQTIGAVVAADSKDAVCALDQAIISELRLCMSIVEGATTSGLPINWTQKLLQSMSSGIASVVAGRAEMTQTVRYLTAMQRDSNLHAVSYGCPNGMPATGVCPTDLPAELSA
jgi:hypothetical protein